MRGLKILSIEILRYTYTGIRVRVEYRTRKMFMHVAILTKIPIELTHRDW